MKIGTGVLNWQRSERVSDRYGAIHLTIDQTTLEHATSDNAPESTYIHFDPSLIGQKGKLMAKVMEARDSYHIGDLFRGVFPTKPEIGEELELGIGTLFIDEDEIGLKPDDGRDHDWLEINALYRLHNQTVELSFEPIQ